MNEKYLHPQQNSGEDEPTSPEIGTTTEPGGDYETELRWAISDAILTAVYNLVEEPGDTARAAIFTLADRLVQHIYSSIPSNDQQVLTRLTRTVNDRIIGLAQAYDELTTSDLQGSVEALAFMLVRQQLPVVETKPIEGGDHE